MQQRADPVRCCFIDGRLPVDEKIMTLHPDPGKQGVRIDRAKYDQVAEAIQDALREHGELTFMELVQVVEAKLQAQFSGSISWYVITVKLDLEARGKIARAPKAKPQRVRLAG
jgi:hypothetical protein